MNDASRISVAILLGLSLGAFASLAEAKDTRDQAMAKCIEKAQAAYPFLFEGVGKSRASVYKACMKTAGYKP